MAQLVSIFGLCFCVLVVLAGCGRSTTVSVRIRSLSAEQVQAIRVHNDIVRSRIASYVNPAAPPKVTVQDSTVSVSYAGQEAPAAEIRWLLITPCAFLMKSGSTGSYMLVRSSHIVAASPTEIRGDPYINVELTPAAASRLEKFTAANVGELVEILIDGRTISVAEVLGEYGSPFVFSIDESDLDAALVAACLTGGELPGSNAMKSAQ